MYLWGILKRIFSDDDASLLEEMDAAERAWEAERAANPEAAVEAERDMDEQFDKLMKNIRDKGIQPVSEEEYENREKKCKLHWIDRYKDNK